MTQADEAPLSEEQLSEVIARYPDRTGDVLSILERLQEMHPLNYLPKETLIRVAEAKRLALSNVFSVVTFYSFFNLCPQGRHTVTVCRGTACHTRGSNLLMNGLRAEIGGVWADGQSSYTTPDHELSVHTVACFGQCAMAPFVAVDHEIYGRMSEMKLRQRVRQLVRKESNDEDS